MVVPTHKPTGVIKIWQNLGMLVWHAHGAHLVLAFKQLIADFAGIFLKCILSKCQLIVSEDATGVQR